VLTEAQLTRICARHQVERKQLLVVAIFLRAHPETSFIRGLFDLVCGRGPAAVATGRLGQRRAPRPRLPHPGQLVPLPHSPSSVEAQAA